MLRTEGLFHPVVGHFSFTIIIYKIGARHIRPWLVELPDNAAAVPEFAATVSLQHEADSFCLHPLAASRELLQIIHATEHFFFTA
ncbi:hypothetical protein D3C71_1330070 [compost metagenome]